MHNVLIISYIAFSIGNLFILPESGIGIRRFSIGGNGLAWDMIEDTDEQADALLLLNYKR